MAAAVLPPLVLSQRPESVSTANDRQALYERLTGQNVVLPNLYKLLPGWEHSLNPFYETIKEDVDEWCLSFIEDPKMRRRIKVTDPTRVAATFFPRAGKEELTTIAYYMGWVFTWDDEIDCGLYIDDNVRTKRYVAETIDYLNYLLGPDREVQEPPKTTFRYVHPLKDICDRMCRGFDKDGKARMLHQLKRFINSTLRMQATHQKHDVMTLENFVFTRLANIAIGIDLVFVEYAENLCIPAEIYDHEAMRAISHLTEWISVLNNDIISLPKELFEGSIDNFVPLLMYHHGMEAQSAINVAAQMIRTAATQFEAAEQRLPLTGDSKLDQNIRRYAEACKEQIIGLVHWSYVSKRYFKPSQMEPDKTIKWKLQVGNVAWFEKNN